MVWLHYSHTERVFAIARAMLDDSCRPVPSFSALSGVVYKTKLLLLFILRDPGRMPIERLDSSRHSYGPRRSLFP